MDFASLVANHSPFTVHAVPLDDRFGRDVLVVIAKLAYEFDAVGATLATVPAEIRRADVPTAPAPWSSLRFPTDIVDEKPGTDVLVLGTAHRHAGGFATHRDVSVRIAAAGRPVQKTLRVHGRRVWHRTARGLVPGPSAPLEATPIVYELAWGGVDDGDPAHPVVEWRNPAGSGACVHDSLLVGAPAPQIEDRDAPLGSGEPQPAGFGPIAPTWQPRAGFAGTYDPAWRSERAPLRPLDFDPRHNCAASPGLWSERPLVGDEAADLVGLRPEGRFGFRLPRLEPGFVAMLGGECVRFPTHLDTWLIDADARRVELSWRVRIPIPRRLHELRRVEVSAWGALPVRSRSAAEAGLGG